VTPANGRVDAERQFAREMHRWLAAALPADQVGDLGTHLSDIRFSVGEVEKSIAALVGISPSDAVAVRKGLLTVHTQLYRHLTLHLEQMREPIRDVIDGLFEEELDATDRPNP
jgi:hypothetical protein